MTEDIAYDWLANGGKHFRPFITLAAYDAMTEARLMKGESGVESPGQDPAMASPGQSTQDAVAKIAMAIEAFHKASLVHDDIQDDDLFRYGRETLHRTVGMGPAINIGDYLIGIGYRLIHGSRDALGAEVACDILDSMATAHIKLCDGQGAEMAWQNKPDWDFTPLDALTIYALKTSPAFEAALYSGLRMAGPMDKYRELVPNFCRQVGVGFQILNDLKDWRGDVNNKLVAGQDALALRPTLLLALALDKASDAEKQAIRGALEGDAPDSERIDTLRTIFESRGVFEKAEALVEKSRARAEAMADEVEPQELRQLLYFFIDTVLAEEGEPTPAEDLDPPLIELSLSH
ncbi:MAG: polyprenyl synthetase family protein [Planctomycetaceae bacterium]